MGLPTQTRPEISSTGCGAGWLHARPAIFVFLVAVPVGMAASCR